MSFRLTDAEFAEALAVLKDLIRIDTTNPPGGERPAAEYLAEIFRKEGLTPEMDGADPDRPNLACRLPATNPGPGQRPFVLSCHLDVVPAHPARWTHPPFAAVEAGGCVWGRGAVDMKGFAAMAVTLLRFWKRHRIETDRDLILAAVADEEAGTQFGSRWLVKNRPDLLGGNPEYVINEVGGFTLHRNGRRFYPVQVAEKGLAWLHLTIRGTPGHSSLPAPDSALAQLGWAIDRIARARLPWHVSKPARNFLTGIAAASGVVPRLFLPLLLNPLIGPALLPLAVTGRSRRASVEAILRNTANPTVTSSGTKINVVPETAGVEIDGRLAPGQTAGDLIRELRTVLRDPDGRRFEIKVLLASKATVFPRETPLFHTIRQVMSERDPGGVVVPSIVPGFTDSANYADLGAICYGFYPLRLPENLDFAGLFHGIDERIPIDGFRWGIETLGDLLARFLRPPGNPENQ